MHLVCTLLIRGLRAVSRFLHFGRCTPKTLRGSYDNARLGRVLRRRLSEGLGKVLGRCCVAGSKAERVLRRVLRRGNVLNVNAFDAAKWPNITNFRVPRQGALIW